MYIKVFPYAELAAPIPILHKPNCDGVYQPLTGSAGVNPTLWAKKAMLPQLC